MAAEDKNGDKPPSSNKEVKNISDGQFTPSKMARLSEEINNYLAKNKLWR